MPNFDPISSVVNSMLANVWSIITTILQNATQTMLMGTIDLLMASPWPDLSSDGFKSLWNNAFGLVLIVSFMYLALSAIASMLSAKDSTLGETSVWVLRNFGTGSFMLVIVLAGMAVADFLMLLLNALFGSLVSNPDWGNILLQDRDYSQADAIAQFHAFSVISTNATLMYIQANVASGALMMYLIWYLFAGVFGNRFIGKLIRSLLLATVFTQVFARVAQVALLGIGAIITDANIDGFTPIQLAVTSAITTSASVLVQPLMLIALTIQFYKHERSLDPSVIAKSVASQKTSEFETQKLNSRRASVMTSTRDNAKELGQEVVRTAAIAASIAGIAKVTALVLAKIPTPQTKVAALGVAAIGVGSKALQNQASNRISNRVGRVGRPQNK